ncbi:uncharacterized protein LOC123644694 isoform X2 [Lemur catta]|uniref:uncharacterized protein LOC123644694 isoform X2 n=1 Tax=Lemur catta TaxID=9447 RepID=UPI001E26D6E5|nr:uncharacterized protein LOC123644694 isoform X2 [Lemur catta]
MSAGAGSPQGCIGPLKAACEPPSPQPQTVGFLDLAQSCRQTWETIRERSLGFSPPSGQHDHSPVFQGCGNSAEACQEPGNGRVPCHQQTRAPEPPTEDLVLLL